MTKLYISMYIEWVEWFTYLLMGTFSYMDNVQHNSLWASYLLKLGECWKKAISPSFSTYFFISSNSTSSYIPLLSTLLPGHTVVDLLWNLMTDLSWLTGTFLSRNQLRNLSCNIPAWYMVYRAAYRNIDRLVFLYRYIVSIPSENLNHSSLGPSCHSCLDLSKDFSFWTFWQTILGIFWYTGVGSSQPFPREPVYMAV